ncbi:MAG: hypothetical protein HDT27_01655 [Subdoligranulum sp.]|nr:hypothetical protein [Subdoligranulum sp.]
MGKMKRSRAMAVRKWKGETQSIRPELFLLAHDSIGIEIAGNLKYD